MTFQEYDKRINGVIKDLQSGKHGEVMLRLGINALTKIKQRVQETGTNAKGSKYKPYSRKPMLANCSTMTLSACETIAGSKEKRRNMEWRTVRGHKLFILPGGYKQYRELHGRQTAFVDFMFSGRMWSNIAVISNQAQHQNMIAVIGAKQDIEKKKLAGNTARKGDILDLSQKEIDELKASYYIDTLQIFKNNGL
jgi:hypothetical protein